MRLSYDSTLKRAKRSKSCLSPAFLKRMVAFALSPSPSTFKTSPRPKRSCSISCPCCTQLADPPAEGDVLAVFAEGATRFKLRGTVGAIICCFGRTDTRSFPPYGASSLSGAKPLAFSLRKAAASSSTCGTFPHPEADAGNVYLYPSGNGWDCRTPSCHTGNVSLHTTGNSVLRHV